MAAALKGPLGSRTYAATTKRRPFGVAHLDIMIFRLKTTGFQRRQDSQLYSALEILSSSIRHEGRLGVFAICQSYWSRLIGSWEINGRGGYCQVQALIS
jgi:hypothetical protein